MAENTKDKLKMANQLQNLKLKSENVKNVEKSHYILFIRNGESIINDKENF
jgi:hypothetical protein